MRYMARRHLGVEPEEWPRLPWWKARLYQEGLAWEFAPAEEQETTAELADLGFNVTPIERFG